ncbi:hypothetical protein [Sphingopyxis microcysteis]|uniref:hypothetical protein n=1 Tax=Sphingopyxis microcysteis TaxID=2484145 RepID=UPI0014468D4F|nr:hypothetical protein [Sphingopyxis microcysteis]
MPSENIQQEISKWLVASAKRVEIPFKRQKFRKSLGEVAIGVEIYVMRYNRQLACVEYTFYWPKLAEKFFEWKNAPAMTWRMMDKSLEKEKSRGDVYLSKYAEDRIAMENEVVLQGENLFHNVNSVRSFLQLLSGQIRQVPATSQELKHDWPNLLDQINATGLAGVYS